MMVYRSGTDILFTPWDASEPSGTNEDCISAKFRDIEGAKENTVWFADSCDSQSHYVCQISNADDCLQYGYNTCLVNGKLPVIVWFSC